MTPGQEVVLDDALRQLRLPAMVREWREYARQAKEAGEGYPGFLLALASRELEQRASIAPDNPICTRTVLALPSGHLLAEHPHDRLGVTVNDGQQDACGAIWNTTSLFPILHGPRIETESVRKLLTTQFHTLPNGKNMLCGGIVNNAAG